MDDTPIINELKIKFKLNPINFYDKNIPLDLFLILKSNYVICFIKYLTILEQYEMNNFFFKKIYQDYTEIEKESEYNKNYRIFNEQIINSIIKDISKSIYERIRTMEPNNKTIFINKFKKVI